MCKLSPRKVFREGLNWWFDGELHSDAQGFHLLDSHPGKICCALGMLLLWAVWLNNIYIILPHGSGMMGPGFSLYRDLASRQCQQPAQTNSRLSGSHTMSSLLDVPSEAYLSGRNSDLDLLKAFSNASHLASILFSPSMFPMGPPSRYHISLGILWLRNLSHSHNMIH